MLVVDDDPLFREAISSLLEPDERFHVVGLAANGEEAIQRALLLRPEVVTMDIDMPIVDGVQATKRIAEMLPDVRVLVVSASIFAERGETARAAGASGYITKSRVPNELIDVLVAVAAGENFVIAL